MPGQVKFRALLIREESLSFLGRCWLQKPTGARGCCLAYSEMFWLNMDLGVCKLKPNSDLVSNKTFGEWAAAALHAVFEGIGICIFLWGSLITDSVGSDKKNLFEELAEMSAIQGRALCSPQMLMAITGESSNVGMEWGKLAASASSVLGKNRSTEIFPSLLNRCRTLLTPGARKAGQDQCLA